MIRAVDEGLKNGVRFSIKNCYLAFDSEEFNKAAWMREHPLQSLVFVTAVYLTKIIEQDYFGEDGEDL
jgi:hypothetical protein